MLNTSSVFDARSHSGYRSLGTPDIAPLLTPYTFTLLLPVPGMGLLELIPHHGLAHQCGWASEEEAESFRKVAVRAMEDKVHVVLKNADFTEGRGPMFLHKVFRRLESAELYVSQQGGIFGSQPHRYVNYGVNIHGDLYGSVSWNGYEIRSVDIE